MSREYSENVLVQNSAGNLLQNVLGWEVVLAYNSEKLGPDGTLGRTSYGEVLLTRYFRQALLRLNPWLTPNQLDEVQKKFTAHVSTASLMQINEEKYFLLRDGIPVTVKRPDGRTEIRSAAVIDFKNPENNHFLAVRKRNEDPLAAVPPPDRHCGLCQWHSAAVYRAEKAHRGCAERLHRQLSGLPRYHSAVVLL